jgi:hypothetical protein
MVSSVRSNTTINTLFVSKSAVKGTYLQNKNINGLLLANSNIKISSRVVSTPLLLKAICNTTFKANILINKVLISNIVINKVLISNSKFSSVINSRLSNNKTLDCILNSKFNLQLTKISEELYLNSLVLNTNSVKLLNFNERKELSVLLNSRCSLRLYSFLYERKKSERKFLLIKRKGFNDRKIILEVIKENNSYYITKSINSINLFDFYYRKNNSIRWDKMTKSRAEQPINNVLFDRTSFIIEKILSLSDLVLYPKNIMYD